MHERKRPDNHTQRIPTSMAATTPDTQKLRVTPDVARRWLGQNTASNRNVSPSTVHAYATEMKAGRWELTHQSIAFNRAGELIDGQHRLHAVIEADVAVDMMVTTGLAIEYNSPIDQGYNRRASHILGKSSRWVSVVRSLISLETGLPGYGEKALVGRLEETAKRHAASIEAILAQTPSGRACPTGCVAALIYMHPLAIERMEHFAKEVNDGELLAKGDPSLALRRWIQVGRHTPRETILATIAAGKAFLQNKPLTKIMAGVSGTDRDGSSNYQWVVARRRALRIWDGTPSVEIVPARGRGPGAVDDTET